MGGTKHLKQIEEWKTSTWSFSADFKDVLRQKHRLEIELQNEVSKRRKVEAQVSDLCKESADQRDAIAAISKAALGKTGRSLSSKTWN